ncbi:MAG TPA: Hsp20/alpha crystallin family protein [Candidatus Hydrogenedentes bacterium]|nr:Hsp20/alpha crystallin family protein [Candidatus Hydrogenedentota bacterium]HQE84572.1 Hsp20/alpha crystallin family protein [Candidatus Hydrogenedentota bacterium]HQH53769.1 Hsp20/alpha crystallin family protein [Candidatus Hydrogenedentota bacterium]HQM47637.1 Hsp20/alpha crystallin family protein [Candidatus Hydrogenedentota bacterium]
MTKLLPANWRSSVDELRDRVMHTFDRWLPENWRRESPVDLRNRPSSVFAGRGPVIDLEETDDDIVVTAELPGLDKSDFNVEVEGQRLILRGERKASHEEKGRLYHYSECAYGSFYRSVPLPCDVEAGKSTAKYRKGVLTVTLPKTAEAKTRSIRVKIS